MVVTTIPLSLIETAKLIVNNKMKLLSAASLFLALGTQVNGFTTLPQVKVRLWLIVDGLAGFALSLNRRQ